MHNIQHTPRPIGSFVKLLGLGPGRTNDNWGVYVSGGIGTNNEAETKTLTNSGFVMLYGRRGVVGKLKSDPNLSEFPMRWTLPYVLHRAADGREFLVNRDNSVLCSRIDSQIFIGGGAVLCRSGQDRGEMIYDDSCKPWRDERSLARCRAVLAEWGVRPRPWTGLNGVSGVELAS